MKRSQAERILDYLATGRTLTALEALDWFDCLRLAARVHELCERGHDIRSQLINDGGKQYAEYWIEYPARAR